MNKEKQIIISLGGSIIVPDQIDVEFLNSFISLVREYTDKGYKFFIITGGGKVSRNYNDSLKQITKPTDEELDWLGISATRLNAEFVKIAFGGLAYKDIILDPDSTPNTDKPIVVGGGWKPGNSSDLAAVRVAKNTGSTKIINLSNIDYVYDSDPKNNPNAKKIESISWGDYRSSISTKWDPGMSSPFDPIASKEAEEYGMEVVIMNGKNTENLRGYLEGRVFKGTIIK